MNTQEEQQIQSEQNNQNQIEYEIVNKGNGLNFGVDYLGYKGDIATTHSNYIISINEDENKVIETSDIIRIGRVTANTNKQGIIMNESGEGIKITWKMRQKIDFQQD